MIFRPIAPRLAMVVVMDRLSTPPRRLKRIASLVALAYLAVSFLWIMLSGIVATTLAKNNPEMFLRIHAVRALARPVLLPNV